MHLSGKVSSRDKPLRVKGRLEDRSKRLGFFLLFNMLYGVVFFAHWATLFGYSLNGQYYPFGLIPLLTLYLLVTRSQGLFAHAVYGVRSGVAFALSGALIYSLGLVLRPTLSPQDIMSLTTLGIVIIWIGGFVICFGIPGARAALFPLFFLIFAIPPPTVLVSHLIAALQYASVEVTYALFKLMPIPVFRSGTYFSLPGLDFEVASACSGIRSSVALLVTCTLASNLLLRRWWSRAIILLLVLPLSVFKNGVRIVTICLLSIYVDEGFMTGDLHTQGGIVFFALALAIMGLVLLGLRKLEAQGGIR